MNRDKSIKIRVSEDEFDRLKANCTGNQLAVWMREMCLGKQSRKRNPPPTVDPDLLRQLAAIGNNVNQLAKQVNSGQLGTGQVVQILASLDAIEQQLYALRTDHAG
ncbi:MAG: MobC family plasmid mobilization relaxosome protein [Paraglaciecola sp.]|nr:MobC family plasmid mobilization relaxosome protein [Paraglaciecola sp.]